MTTGGKSKWVLQGRSAAPQTAQCNCRRELATVPKTPVETADSTPQREPCPEIAKREGDQPRPKTGDIFSEAIFSKTVSQFLVKTCRGCLAGPKDSTGTEIIDLSDDGRALTHFFQGQRRFLGKKSEIPKIKNQKS